MRIFVKGSKIQNLLCHTNPKKCPFLSHNFAEHIGFSIDQTYHIMEFVNEWFPYGNFREVDTPFWTDSTYEKELMVSIICTGNSIQR